MTLHETIFGSQGNILTFYAHLDGMTGFIIVITEFSQPIIWSLFVRVIGPNKNNCILTANCTAIPRRIIRLLNSTEVYNDTEKRKPQRFDDIVLSKLGDSMSTPVKSLSQILESCADEDEPDVFTKPEESTDDWFLNSFWTIYLPQGKEMKSAKIIILTEDTDENIVETYDASFMLIAWWQNQGVQC